MDETHAVRGKMGFPFLAGAAADRIADVEQRHVVSAARERQRETLVGRADAAARVRAGDVRRRDAHPFAAGGGVEIAGNAEAWKLHETRNHCGERDRT